LLTAIGLTPGGSSTVHIYTQTIHRTTQLIWEECGPCPLSASYTLAFALQLRKKHGKTSIRVDEYCQLARWSRLHATCKARLTLLCRLRLKCDGTRAETRFGLSAKRTSPFKSAGASVQSTAGNRGVPISGINAGYTMFRGSVKSTGYPLHSPLSPSLPLSCVTVCHQVSTGLYWVVNRNWVGQKAINWHEAVELNNWRVEVICEIRMYFRHAVWLLLYYLHLFLHTHACVVQILEVITWPYLIAFFNDPVSIADCMTWEEWCSSYDE
jgi:hypothetical protein